MELGSIFLILALLLLVGLFVSRPFFERSESRRVSVPSQVEHDRSALLAERDRLLNALQELDFDYTMGKIPEEDYPAQRTALVQRGADVLRMLDAKLIEKHLAEESEAHTPSKLTEPELEGISIPAGMGNGRLTTSRVASAAVAAPDDELEVLLANRRRARQDKAAGFCPKCGGPLRRSDHFCPKCGAHIA